MKRARLVLTAAILIAGSSPAGAQVVHQVEVVSNFFSPSRLSIQSGETVRWVARNAGHAVQADDGRFHFPASGTLGAGESAEFTFTTDDEWVRYRCAVHPEMRGAIKIGDPPSVGGSEPSEIRVVPSPAYPTIADALAGIPEGAAVDLAPGLYDASVVLEVDGVRLRGTGASPGDVILRGGGRRGVGVTGRATGVRVENLTLAGYTVAGILMIDADRFAVDAVHVDATFAAGGRAGHGIRVQGSRYGRIGDAEITGADAAGIQVEGCAPCDLIVERSIVEHSTVGLLARAAGSLIVRGSVFEGNTTGIVLSNRDAEAAGQGAHILGNTVRANNAPFAPRPTAPLRLAPNVGIWIDGGRHIVVEGNHVGSHRYGIALTGVGGPSLMDRIVGNEISGSSEADLAWDGIGIGTCFSGNAAPGGAPASSYPPLLATLYPCTDVPAIGIPIPLVTAKVLLP